MIGNPILLHDDGSDPRMAGRHARQLLSAVNDVAGRYKTLSQEAKNSLREAAPAVVGLADGVFGLSTVQWGIY